MPQNESNIELTAMLTTESIKEMALSFPEAIEQDHFGRPSFRVRKKIFATLWPMEKILVLKLNEIEQSVFSDIDRTAVYPVDGGWGKQGFTKFEYTRLNKSIIKDALTHSYCNVAPKPLSDKYLNPDI